MRLFWISVYCVFSLVALPVICDFLPMLWVLALPWWPLIAIWGFGGLDSLIAVAIGMVFTYWVLLEATVIAISSYRRRER